MIRAGYYYAAALIAAGLALGWLLGWPAALPGLLLAAFFLYFFRDPRRAPPPDERLIVAPADGKVTLAAPEGEGYRISIFLSVFDVHVNRAPMAGWVSDVERRPGRFMNALRAESAVVNEQVRSRLEGPQGKLEMIQIAGLLARRIEFWPRPGTKIERGQRVGLIKFGSRVDLRLPPEARPRVRVGDRVKGGESVVAEWSVGSVEMNGK